MQHCELQAEHRQTLAVMDGRYWVWEVADVAPISRQDVCVDAAQQHEHYGSKNQEQRRQAQLVLLHVT